MDRSNVKVRRKIIGAVKSRVLAHHINIGRVDYEEWERHVNASTESLLSAEAAEFEAGVQKLLDELKSSHTAFFHELPSSFPSQYTVGATFRRRELGGEDRWMFLDVFDGSAVKTAGIVPGDVLLPSETFGVVPPSAPKFPVGTSCEIRIWRGATKMEEAVRISIPAKKASGARPPIVEPVSVESRLLEPDLAFLRVTYFSGSFGLGFSKVLDRHMRELETQGASRLILDLRGNIGGSLGFARLASYLCSDQRAIGFSVTPKRLRSGFNVGELPRVPMPDGVGSLFSALIRFARKDKSLMLLTQGLGSRRFHNRVVVLLNEWTTSAGEMAASFIAENRLGVTVGETTRGAVLGASNFPVGGGYWVRIPVFGWFNPSGESLEGRGVTPDVSCGIDAEGLAGGHDNQMEAAVKIARGL